MIPKARDLNFLGFFRFGGGVVLRTKLTRVLFLTKKSVFFSLCGRITRPLWELLIKLDMFRKEEGPPFKTVETGRL